MKENRWSWLSRLVWLMFIIVTITSIVTFFRQPFVSSLDYPQISVMFNIPLGYKIINIWGLLMSILTIISALIGAATISMIESIYKIVAKNNK